MRYKIDIEVVENGFVIIPQDGYSSNKFLYRTENELLEAIKKLLKYQNLSPSKVLEEKKEIS